MSEYRRWIHQCKSITSPTLAALNNDCDNVAAAAPSVLGATSVNFDKVNGAGNTVYAIVTGEPEETMDFLNVAPYIGSGKIYWLIEFSALTNLAYSFVRLGSSASSYFEWRFADSSHTAGKFTLASANLCEAYVTGTPTLVSPDYLEFGAAFDAEANTLADILMDGIWVDVA